MRYKKYEYYHCLIILYPARDNINSMNPNTEYITYKDVLKPSFNGSNQQHKYACEYHDTITLVLVGTQKR